MECALCSINSQLVRDHPESALCSKLIDEVIGPLLLNLGRFLEEMRAAPAALVGEQEGVIVSASPKARTAEFGEGEDREVEVLEVRPMPHGVVGMCCEEKTTGTYVKVAVRAGRTLEVVEGGEQVKLRPNFAVGESLRLIKYVFKPAERGKLLGCYQTYVFSRRKAAECVPKQRARLSLGFSYENVDPRRLLETPDASKSQETEAVRNDIKSPLHNIGVQGSIDALSRRSSLGLTRDGERRFSELGLTAGLLPEEKRRRMECQCCSNALEGCADLRAHAKHKFDHIDRTPEGFWDLHFMETQRHGPVR